MTCAHVVLHAALIILIWTNVVITRWRLGGVLSVYQNQVVLHEVQTTTQASNYPCIEVYNFCGKTQNRMVNQHDTRIWISFVFEKFWVFLSLSFVFFYRFLRTFQFFSFILRQHFSVTLCFPLKFCVGNWRTAARIDPLAHSQRLTAVLYEYAWPFVFRVRI